MTFNKTDRVKTNAQKCRREWPTLNTNTRWQYYGQAKIETVEIENEYNSIHCKAQFSSIKTVLHGYDEEKKNTHFKIIYEKENK